MGKAQDPSAGLVTRVWRWRAPLAAVVIGGGVLVAANAESLGILDVDFFPVQVSELNSLPVRLGGGPASPRRNETPPHARSADPSPSSAARNTASGILRVAGVDLALDWQTKPASDDKAMEDPRDRPEFISISSPVGAGQEWQAGRSGDADFLGSSLGGGPSGAGGGIGSRTREAATADTPDASTAPDPQESPPPQPLVAQPLAAGAIPEPGAWTTLIVGLGLTGAMLRLSRRVRGRPSR